ncbi:unnamed protein product [Rotaria sp. Silwood2]|nr:unnamed protein product [Rotaria sp. Silwood2]
METTGDACQYRTSYKPREILWGFRFKPTSFTIENGKINFDMTTFEEYEPVNMDGYIGKCRGPKLFALDLSSRIYARRKRRTSRLVNESPLRVNA